MAATATTDLVLGSPAPPFSLPNAVDGKQVSLADFEGASALLVMFICNHCPYVVHVRAELGRLERDFRSRGLELVAINSNSIVAYPQDGPVHMAELARAEGWGFPFLFDETQEVARAYHAACTPDLYLFDRHQRLHYHGQLDDSRPKNDLPVDGRDLRAAIEGALAGEPAPADQKLGIGCSIKWNG